MSYPLLVSETPLVKTGCALSSWVVRLLCPKAKFVGFDVLGNKAVCEFCCSELPGSSFLSLFEERFRIECSGDLNVRAIKRPRINCVEWALHFDQNIIARELQSRPELLIDVVEIGDWCTFLSGDVSEDTSHLVHVVAFLDSGVSSAICDSLVVYRLEVVFPISLGERKKFVRLAKRKKCQTSVGCLFEHGVLMKDPKGKVFLSFNGSWAFGCVSNFITAEMLSNRFCSVISEEKCSSTSGHLMYYKKLWKLEGCPRRIFLFSVFRFDNLSCPFKSLRLPSFLGHIFCVKDELMLNFSFAVRVLVSIVQRFSFVGKIIVGKDFSEDLFDETVSSLTQDFPGWDIVIDSSLGDRVVACVRDCFGRFWPIWSFGIYCLNNSEGNFWTIESRQEGDCVTILLIMLESDGLLPLWLCF